MRKIHYYHISNFPKFACFFSKNFSYIPTGLHIKLKDWEAHGSQHSPLFQHINLCVLCISYKLDFSYQNLWDCLCLLRIHVACILSLTMTDEWKETKQKIFYVYQIIWKQTNRIHKRIIITIWKYLVAKMYVHITATNVSHS